MEAILITMVLCFAVFSVGGTRWGFARAVALSSIAVLARWMHFVWPDQVPQEVHLGASLLALAYIAQQYLRFVIVARRVDTDVLCTGISAFLMMALLWAMAYTIVDRTIPGSFSFTVGPEAGRSMKGFVAVYFSMVTLCTVGFGDIVPVSSVARMLAMFEGAAGVMFVAVMLSRLVSLYSSNAPGSASGNGAEGQSPAEQ